MTLDAIRQSLMSKDYILQYELLSIVEHLIRIEAQVVSDISVINRRLDEIPALNVEQDHSKNA